jgi:hypothetical protein
MVVHSCVILGNQIKAVDALAAGLQPLSNHDAVEAMKQGYPPTLFESCWDQYAITNGPMRLQTPATLSAAIIVFAEERMPARIKANMLGQAAAAAAVSTERELEARIRARLLTEFGNAFAAQQQKAPQAKQDNGQGPKAFVEVQYCHTHGPFGAKGHHSGRGTGGCLKPGPDHKYDATVDNHKGGRDERWRKR